MQKVRSAVTVLLVSVSFMLGCSAEAVDPNEDVAESSENLIGFCSATAFDKCVDEGGGGGCAKHCTGAGSPTANEKCQKAVAACVQGGGGKPCKNRCATAEPSSVCYEQEEWSVIATKKCGIVIPIPPRWKVLPGKVRATCKYRVCQGEERKLLSCSEWGVGRNIQCTEGVPIDAAGNPY